MRVTRDMLDVEPDLTTSDKRYKVVAWSIDGVRCTVDSGLTADEAEGLRNALAITIETWT